jgi:hypothetical protein
MEPKIYVYCSRGSTGAFSLAKELGATRLRRFDGMNFWDKNKRVEVPEGSVIICWGMVLPKVDGLRVLNSMDKWVNKLDQARSLIAAKVPTITVAQYKRGCNIASYEKEGYILRTSDHTGGLDILTRTKNPDFFVKKEQIVEEYRIHSFNGKSIRAGKKIPRDGFNPIEDEKLWKPESNLLHPWIRSWDGGWKISYNQFTSSSEMRKIAGAAVKALGLTFGAVDLARRANGSLFVLEVNAAPGIEGGTVKSYERAVNKWIKNPQVEED